MFVIAIYLDVLPKLAIGIAPRSRIGLSDTFRFNRIAKRINAPVFVQGINGGVTRFDGQQGQSIQCQEGSGK